MERNLYTNFYKYLAVAILCIGFILGIVFGYNIPLAEITEDSLGNIDTVEKFNEIAMLITWISSLIACIIPVSIYSICTRLEMIIDNTYPKRNHKNKDIEHEVETENNTKRNTEKFIWE